MIHEQQRTIRHASLYAISLSFQHPFYDAGDELDTSKTPASVGHRADVGTWMELHECEQACLGERDISIGK